MEEKADRTTIGRLVGVCRFGRASLLNQPEIGKSAVESKNTVTVTIPKKAKKSRLERVTQNGNEISYCYQGWEVGEGSLHFNNPAISIRMPEVSAQDSAQAVDSGMMVPETESVSEENAEVADQGFEEKVDGYMDNVTLGFLHIWDSFNNWVNANEILAAGIGLILILLLIPLLVIAYIRDKSARLTRKERERDEEERKKLEENIENKSVQEIEAEIRAELEKERIAREKEEQRKREAKEEEMRMAEMEAIIDRQNQPQTEAAAEEQNQPQTEDTVTQNQEGNQEKKEEQDQEGKTDTDLSENAEVKDELGSTD